MDGRRAVHYAHTCSGGYAVAAAAKRESSLKFLQFETNNYV